MDKVRKNMQHESHDIVVELSFSITSYHGVSGDSHLY